MSRINPIKKELRSLRVKLKTLSRSVDRLTRLVRESGVGTDSTPKRRRPKLTPERREQLKLHGRYLGYVRQLKPAEKTKVRAVQSKRGYRAAITLARKLADRT